MSYRGGSYTAVYEGGRKRWLFVSDRALALGGGQFYAFMVDHTKKGIRKEIERKNLLKRLKPGFET